MKATEDGELEARVAERTAALEAFAALAAHELQEPLRKLQMFGDLLKPGSDVTAEETAEYVARMRDAARRMGRLVEDILVYSRAGAGQRPRDLVDLTAAAAEAAADYQALAAREGGVLEVGPLPQAPGDRLQLRQLFGCLLSNAFKFRRPGVPPRVTVRGVPAGAGLVGVAVADNGIGFEEALAPRIFEPFQRLHRRTDYEGSGLGLALCARIAARHGGSVSARSVPGQGSTFTVVLAATGEA